MFDELSELSLDELQYVIDIVTFSGSIRLWFREELISDLGKRGGEPIPHIVRVSLG